MILGEVNAFGGTNKFFGQVMIVFAGVCGFILLVIAFLYCFKVRGNEKEFYDPLQNEYD